MLSFEEFSDAICRAGHDVPLLAFRCSEIERIAWRDGTAAAKALEARCASAFAASAARNLREEDIIAHVPGSEVFLASLIGRARRSDRVAFPADCRTTVSRMAVSLAEAAGTTIQSGWAMASPESFAKGAGNVVEGALERGARERERIAFFSTVGHELRTPLTAVRGYLETVLDDTKLDPGAARHFLEIARAETLRMGRLVDGMLDISLLDLGANEVSGEVSEVGACAHEACNTVLSSSLRRSTVIERTGLRDHFVRMSRDHLTAVLVNIIDNAVKHGRERGRVVISAHRRGDRFVDICVDDDGCGIPSGEREFVFSMARRGEHATAAGCGIGLAVVRMMLERAGGEIDIAQSPLGGARFILRVPAARQTDATRPV